MARSALRTPTPSTEQNISKNSRSTSDRNPTRRGVSLPVSRIAFQVVHRVQADFGSHAALQLASDEIRDQNLVIECPGGQCGIIISDAGQVTVNACNQVRFTSFLFHDRYGKGDRQASATSGGSGGCGKANSRQIAN